MLRIILSASESKGPDRCGALRESSGGVEEKLVMDALWIHHVAGAYASVAEVGTTLA